MRPIAGQHCLLLGAKGAGMTALAEILADMGHSVTGLDKTLAAGESDESSHSRIRILPWQHNDVRHLRFDLCVASPAIPENDALVQQQLNAGIPVLSLQECLAEVFSGSHQICVAGTHGKSTTSAMLSWILDFAGLRPGFFVGAHQSNFNASGRAIEATAPTAETFSILESCEFSRSFHKFQPRTVVLTGIERDHFDCFPEQQSEDTAFRDFVQKLPMDGTIVFDSSCTRSRAAAAESGRRTATFHVSDEASMKTHTVTPSEHHWVAHQVQQAGCRTSFLLHNNGNEHSVRLAVPGRHNVANATAAIVGAVKNGVPVDVCCEAMAHFRGIRRRFEVRGTYGGITLVDDYAHHPTAIETTLKTARNAFPGRRILAAFEPHQIVRTIALFPEFVNSLLLADEILLLPVFPARETVTHLECCRLSGKLVKELNNRGGRAFLFANLDQIVSRIDHSGRPTDILLTMGAGRTNLIHDQLTRRLQRHSVA